MRNDQILTRQLATVVTKAADGANIPSTLFLSVMEDHGLTVEHVAHHHRIAEHLELCIRARDAWRQE